MDTRGHKREDMFPIMGTVKLNESQVGKGKMIAGVHKTSGKAFQSFLDSMQNSNYIIMTLQKDNRGCSPAEADRNPYLQSVKVEGKDGKPPAMMHGIRISNLKGAQRDDTGAVMKDDKGNVLIDQSKKSQMQQIFEKIPSVEMVRNESGNFMHFAMEAPVFPTSNGNGVMIDVSKMKGKEAEAGMGQAHFEATLEAKRFAKAQREAAQASAPQNERQAEAESDGMDIPAGLELG